MRLSEFMAIWANRAEMYAEKGDHIFIEWAAHVRTLQIRIFMGGWESGKQPTCEFDFRFDEDLKKIEK